MADNLNNVDVEFTPTCKADPESKYRDREYERELMDRFKERMPEKVFDAHFHLSKKEIAGVSEDKVFDVWKSVTEDLVGEGRVAGGLLMGNPFSFKSKEQLDAERLFACELSAAHEGFVNGLLVTPWDDPKEIVGWLEKYPHIVALKPYRVWAQAEDTYEADILDYAPEWIWEIANEWGISVINHLSHYGDMLKDPRNGEQIRYICQKYPKAKMILAHCAMGHHPDKLKSGLHYLEGLDNIYMDCSGVSEALSILYSIQALGPKRVMYGSDGYNFGQMLGRVFAVGGNFMGIHDGDSLDLPPDYRYMPLGNSCEGLLALFAAGDIYGLTDSQWEDIFFGNAAEIFLKDHR